MRRKAQRIGFTPLINHRRVLGLTWTKPISVVSHFLWKPGVFERDILLFRRQTQSATEVSALALRKLMRSFWGNSRCSPLNITVFPLSGQPPGGSESNWRQRGETTAGHRHGGRWRERDQSEHVNRERPWETGRHFHPHSHSYQNYHDEGPGNMNLNLSSNRSHHSRGRHQLAPR